MPRRSPGRRGQPPTVWCATICATVQYLTTHRRPNTSPSLTPRSHVLRLPDFSDSPRQFLGLTSVINGARDARPGQGRYEKLEGAGAGKAEGGALTGAADLTASQWWRCQHS